MGITGKGKDKSIKKTIIDNFRATKDFENLKFQIDFKNEQVIRDTTLVSYLNNNTFKLEYLTEEGLQITRWWFDNFDSAMETMPKINHNLDHRLICVEKNALFIQIGNF